MAWGLQCIDHCSYICRRVAGRSRSAPRLGRRAPSSLRRRRADHLGSRTGQRRGSGKPRGEGRRRLYSLSTAWARARARETVAPTKHVVPRPRDFYFGSPAPMGTWSLEGPLNPHIASASSQSGFVDRLLAHRVFLYSAGDGPRCTRAGPVREAQRPIAHRPVPASVSALTPLLPNAWIASSITLSAIRGAATLILAISACAALFPARSSCRRLEARSRVISMSMRAWRSAPPNRCSPGLPTAVGNQLCHHLCDLAAPMGMQLGCSRGRAVPRDLEPPPSQQHDGRGTRTRHAFPWPCCASSPHRQCRLMSTPSARAGSGSATAFVRVLPDRSCLMDGVGRSCSSVSDAARHHLRPLTIRLPRIGLL